MKKLLLPIVLFIQCLFYSSCVDTVVNPPDKIPPRVEIYSPASNDTLAYGKHNILYYAEDDQKIDYCEVYINSILQKKFKDSLYAVPDIYLLINDSLVGTKIKYFVKVYDSYGNSSTSQEMTNIHVVENTNVPAKPSDLKLEKTTASVKLQWKDNSDNERNFRIFRKKGNEIYKQIDSVGKNIQTYTDNQIDLSLMYYYKVQAVNKFNTASGFSNEINTEGVGELNAPSDLLGTPLGTNKIKLTWKDKSTTEKRFKIQRKNSGDTYFAQLAYVDSNITEYEDRSNLYAGGSYIYRIAAERDTSLSSWSNEVNVVTLSENVVAPYLSATLLTNPVRISISWSYNSWNETEIFIERKTISEDFKEIVSFPKEVTKYEDSNVKMRQTYIYRARIITGQGNYSEYSKEVEISIPDISPAAPSDLSLNRFSSTIFNLEWTDNSVDETGFLLYRSDGNSNSFRIIKEIPANNHSVNDQVPSSDIVYFYKICSYRDSLLSDFSNIINSTGGSGLYPRPTDFKVEATETPEVKLTWKDNTNDELGFKIERKLSWETEFKQITVVSFDTENYIDTEIQRYQTYIYRVKAFNGSQDSDWTESDPVTIP